MNEESDYKTLGIYMRLIFIKFDDFWINYALHRKRERATWLFFFSVWFGFVAVIDKLDKLSKEGKVNDVSAIIEYINKTDTDDAVVWFTVIIRGWWCVPSLTIYASIGIALDQNIFLWLV